MAETTSTKRVDLAALKAALTKVDEKIKNAQAAASAPVATATTVGIVKPGTGLSVDAQGTLSVASTYVQTSAMTSAIATAKAEAIAQAKSDLIDGAPATFDTLKEIADYIAEDKTGAAAMTAEIGKKANSADVYTKTETDTALAAKADAADVYTKTEVDGNLGQIADEVELKANAADVYNKTTADSTFLKSTTASSTYVKIADVVTVEEVEAMCDEVFGA